VTGPTVTANNLMGIKPGTLGNQNVVVGTVIQLPQTPVQNGTAITSDGSGNITLAPNQVYYADYRANLQTTNPQGFQIALALNGTEIPGTNSVFNSFQTSGAFGGTLAGSGLISTAGAAGNSVLSLRGVIGNGSVGSTSVSIIKLQ
jgi:hypothetical protein